MTAQKLRHWAAQNLPLHVGLGQDPDVRVRLEGVDIKPILDKYAWEDSQGSRQRVLRGLLFEALSIEAVADSGKEETCAWNKTQRHGRIVFGNVRSLGFENLRCPDGQDFRLVIDYPFDEEGKTPADDLVAMEAFMEQESSWTLVWLPHFFTEAVKASSSTDRPQRPCSSSRSTLACSPSTSATRTRSTSHRSCRAACSRLKPSSTSSSPSSANTVNGSSCP